MKDVLKVSDNFYNGVEYFCDLSSLEVEICVIGNEFLRFSTSYPRNENGTYV